MRVWSTPRMHQDSRGFRAWWMQPGKELVLCDCGWRPDLGEHYRVELLRRSRVARRGRRPTRQAARRLTG